MLTNLIEFKIRQQDSGVTIISTTRPLPSISSSGRNTTAFALLRSTCFQLPLLGSAARSRSDRALPLLYRLIRL